MCNHIASLRHPDHLYNLPWQAYPSPKPVLLLLWRNSDATNLQDSHDFPGVAAGYPLNLHTLPHYPPFSLSLHSIKVIEVFN
jgi:hypothetical protein